MRDTAARQRYDAWYDTEEGAFALARKEELMRALFSGWPRRSRSVLVLGVGQGEFLESLWESGFDVTGQDSVPEYIEISRKRLGTRAELAFSAPELLPFDDCSFDYAVAVDAFEFWDDPEAVLEEIGRVVCGGLIVLFPNAWSLLGLECRLGRKAGTCGALSPHLKSPRAVNRLIHKVYGPRETAWMANLLAGGRTLRPAPLWTRLNSLRIPLPLGGLVGIRVDFGPQYSGTPLLLTAREPVSSAVVE